MRAILLVILVMSTSPVVMAQSQEVPPKGKVVLPSTLPKAQEQQEKGIVNPFPTGPYKNGEYIYQQTEEEKLRDEKFGLEEN